MPLPKSGYVLQTSSLRLFCKKINLKSSSYKEKKAVYFEFAILYYVVILWHANSKKQKFIEEGETRTLATLTKTLPYSQTTLTKKNILLKTYFKSWTILIIKQIDLFDYYQITKLVVIASDMTYCKPNWSMVMLFCLDEGEGREIFY